MAPKREKKSHKWKPKDNHITQIQQKTVYLVAVPSSEEIMHDFKIVMFSVIPSTKIPHDCFQCMQKKKNARALKLWRWSSTCLCSFPNCQENVMDQFWNTQSKFTYILQHGFKIHTDSKHPILPRWTASKITTGFFDLLPVGQVPTIHFLFIKIFQTDCRRTNKDVLFMATILLLKNTHDMAHLQK